MSETYDVIIIGGGPGGYNCAIRAAQLGLKTACIEKRKTLGGTCLNIGCMPSKALLYSSEMYECAQKDFGAIGIKATVKLDLPAMMDAKDKAVDGLTHGIAYLFKKNKIAHIQGAAEIIAPEQVKVADSILTAKHIIIATGSDVAPLAGIEIDEKDILSSTGALALTQVPQHMVIIGAGVIGLELGSVWRRLGAQVSIVEYLDHILPGMDADIQKQALRIFKKQKLKFELGRKVTKVKKLKSGLKISTEASAGGIPKSLDADKVLIAIGRRPYTTGLGLEALGITTDAHGFIETRDFQTSIANIYAIGDCTHGAMLAHKAEEEGIAVAEQIVGKAGHIDYNTIPAVVYTKPEIATIGSTEDQLKDIGRSYKIGQFPFTANARSRISQATDGLV